MNVLCPFTSGLIFFIPFLKTGMPNCLVGLYPKKANWGFWETEPVTPENTIRLNPPSRWVPLFALLLLRFVILRRWDCLLSHLKKMTPLASKGFIGFWSCLQELRNEAELQEGNLAWLKARMAVLIEICADSDAQRQGSTLNKLSADFKGLLASLVEVSPFCSFGRPLRLFFLVIYSTLLNAVSSIITLGAKFVCGEHHCNYEISGWQDDYIQELDNETETSGFRPQ